MNRTPRSASMPPRASRKRSGGCNARAVVGSAAMPALWGPCSMSCSTCSRNSPMRARRPSPTSALAAASLRRRGARLRSPPWLASATARRPTQPSAAGSRLPPNCAAPPSVRRSFGRSRRSSGRRSRGWPNSWPPSRPRRRSSWKPPPQLLPKVFHPTAPLEVQIRPTKRWSCSARPMCRSFVAVMPSTSAPWPSAAKRRRRSTPRRCARSSGWKPNGASNSRNRRPRI
mmetsp:Transcript_116325/g.228221  ORF Transcript_116325/g.228221 Transcript_116325/m.228221 type:complete len:229 (+) Transcript_116325:1097-1783(+)